LGHPPRGGGRAAGVLLPLFSLRSDRDWGIGEIGDLGALCGWLAEAGHRLLQLLPIVEMSAGERSPYAAVSAFAIDPIYVSVGALEDPGPSADHDAAAIDAARADPSIDYDGVRRLKRGALEAAFARFEEGGGLRHDAFRRFCDAAAGWLDDYALFRACQEQHAGAPWGAWEPGLRDREPAALAAARAALARACRFHAWVQWVAAEQWAAARREVNACGVRLKGDLPFMVSSNSADVWARQEEFRLDASLGAPPDAFNAEGQEWGLPVCRWDVMTAREDLAWLRARAARAAELFDVFRIDHVVGFYRQWVVGPGAARGFVPADEGAQRVLGRRLLDAVRRAAGATTVIGEDLGVVPAFVRASLGRLGIAGYRVLRWEEKDGVFRDPRTYPPLSVATTGTHDTSSLAVWWEEELGDAGRRALAELPPFAPLRTAGGAFTGAVHEALLDGLYAAGSDLVVVPFLDAYGGRERINVPATVGRTNWGYRLPWTIAELRGPAGESLRARLRAFAERHERA
jgi:4-alpha-glucanotransferase